MGYVHDDLLPEVSICYMADRWPRRYPQEEGCITTPLNLLKVNSQVGHDSKKKEG